MQGGLFMFIYGLSFFLDKHCICVHKRKIRHTSFEIYRISESCPLGYDPNFCLLLFLYACSKGNERKLHKLKALYAVRDTDDGNAVDNTQNKVCNRYLPTEKHCPQNVRNRMLVVVCYYPLAIREEGQLCRLKALHSKRNTYNSYAKQAAKRCPCKSRPKAAQKHPQNISEHPYKRFFLLFHILNLLYSFPSMS